MEGVAAVVSICLLGAGLNFALPPAATSVTSKPFPRPPRLIGCVFQNRANATCHWEAGDLPATRYTLQIQKFIGGESFTTKRFVDQYNCVTSGTSCTANLRASSVRFIFCVTVMAHSRSANVSSSPRCQPGRIELMLPPVTLSHVDPVNRMSKCLNITWKRTLGVFPVALSEIKGGALSSQVEVTQEGQLGVQVKNAPVKDYSFQVCLFRPDTSYTIRLRHHYRGPQSPWSPWSNALQGRTAEDAPSAAPAFWRQVKQTDKNGSRLISLFWKPLPRSLANGRVLFYNVTCQTDSAQVRKYGSCRDLHHTNMSCTLRLSAERCSCALTASNSAGMSPEAHIRLRGASEAEQPPPSQITATPLDDNNLAVSWAAPANRSVSGFVVEWFAVREKSSSITHWERLNSSCTTHIITKGVKPMERYTISVTVLYGDRGAGKNGMLHIYTRQGVPSAGPVVEVHKISGGSVELSWSPVPVELCHGFIRKYILHYSTANQPARNVIVHGHVRRYSLGKLLPGNYDISMQANTDAGSGAAGPVVNVHIGPDEISVAAYAVLPLLLTFLTLALMACLAQNKMVKQKLCQFVPDPSNSSLAHWIPITTVTSVEQPSTPEKPKIKYSEVTLLGETELQNSGLHEAQTPQRTRMSESTRSPIRPRTTSDTDPTSYPLIYSTAIFSQTPPKNPPPAILSPAYLHLSDWQHSTVSVSDVRQKPGSDGELRRSGTQESTALDSAPSVTDKLQTFRLFLKQNQSLVSFPDFSSVPTSCTLLFHQAEAHSHRHSFLRSNFNSVPSLQPDTFAHPSAPAFLPPVFVDFSYCPVKCDAYISPAV
ncbi:interleukin-6 receptor subunit beta [Echeneis naucrates]|uniref:interleukin-6 receptor subunit beta n=1 Tax=Echeneis naucrates TaxID=173247 RepID=UPI001114275F|nr:interleukin-6 receptor subunit beta-like [Echeneis naucrates]